MLMRSLVVLAMLASCLSLAHAQDRIGMQNGQRSSNAEVGEEGRRISSAVAGDIHGTSDVRGKAVNSDLGFAGGWRIARDSRLYPVPSKSASNATLPIALTQSRKRAIVGCGALSAGIAGLVVYTGRNAITQQEKSLRTMEVGAAILFFPICYWLYGRANE